MSSKYQVGDIVEVIGEGSYWDGAHGPIVDTLNGSIKFNPGDTIPQDNPHRGYYRKQSSCGFYASSLKHKDLEAGDWVRAINCSSCWRLKEPHPKITGAWLYDYRLSIGKLTKADSGTWVSDYVIAIVAPPEAKSLRVRSPEAKSLETSCQDCKLIGGFCKPCVQAILNDEKPRVLEPEVVDICAGVKDQEPFHFEGWETCANGKIYLHHDGVTIQDVGNGWVVIAAGNYQCGMKHEGLLDAIEWTEENL